MISMLSNWQEPFGAQTDPALRLGGFRPGFEKGRPLTLTASVVCGVRRWSIVPSKRLADFRAAIFRRDFDTCQFCGLRSKKHQDVVAQHGVDWSMQAIFTACIFCSPCVSLETVESRRSGVLIWLPEMSQAALNQVMRLVYILRLRQDPIADKARQVLDLFIERRRGAADRLTSEEPSLLAERMRSCATTDELFELNSQLREIRLLPLDRRIIKEAELEFNQFPQILAYWRSKGGPYGSLDWVEPAGALLDSMQRGLDGGHRARPATD